MNTKSDERYEAEIRWTTHGVAHIRAADAGGLGFGQGYAAALDHLPTMADQLVKVRSERARYHGAGAEGQHLASDFGYLALGVVERAAALRAAQPQQIRDLAAGYVAGYNVAAVERKADGSLPAWCAGADWVRPIDELDFYAYLGDVALLGSGRNLAGIIGRAEAPGPDGSVPPSPVSALGGGAGNAAGNAASNGWAFGGDVTASGHGLVVANPHFPWGGEARFWECHLTIPGELDVYGVALLGTPGVQMGFNEGVAWCHTFSRGSRFTLARLDLVAGHPTRYRFGDEERDMAPATHRVMLRCDDGTLAAVERTLWSSHHGPMVNLPLVGWGLETGFTYRDANITNTQVLEQFLGMDKATTLDDFQAVFADVKGMPWVNTLAADASGRCWYIDASATPNLAPEAQARFHARLRDDFMAALLYENRVSLLDGSDPGDEWVDEPGARSPGLIPHDRLPSLERRDYVVNANDSHWLTNANSPLEGYSPLHGLERTPRTMRTRQNLRTAERIAAAGGLTVDGALDALFENTGLSADLLLDDVVRRCRAAGGRAGAVPDGTVADGNVADGDIADSNVPDGEATLARVAAILAAWDRRYELASVGAVLWREIVASFAPGELLDAGPLWAVAFHADDPVATPRGLAPAPAGGSDPIATAVLHAVAALDGAGIGLDAPLGAVQWADRGGRRVALHGGGEVDGILNIAVPVGSLSSTSLEPGPDPLPAFAHRTDRTGLVAGGYRITYGTSFVMAVELTAEGPVGRGLLAYGQSGDPRSPHHVDGTEAYAAKATRPLLFRDADIEADPHLVRRTVSR